MGFLGVVFTQIRDDPENLAKPLTNWAVNNDLFTMWKAQKQTKSLLTREYVEKGYFPGNEGNIAPLVLLLSGRVMYHLVVEAYNEYANQALQDPMNKAKGIKPLSFREWMKHPDNAHCAMYRLSDEELTPFNAERKKIGKQALNDTRDAVIRYATFKDNTLNLPKKLLDHINS